MLGSDIIELADNLGFSTRIYDLPEFDITNDADIEAMVAENDILVNCAAYTAVDQAESEPEKCRTINALAVGKIGEVAKLANKYILHISTDFVFGDNGDRALSEDDMTNPLSMYGTSKLEGEQLLQQSGCRNAIIRIEWTYGLHGKYFVSKIIELSERLDSLQIVGDQFGAPTPTTAVARAVMCFIQEETEGLYHFAARGYGSRYDVAKFVFEKLGITKTLTPCSSTAFAAPAQRPLNSRFDCSKIDGILDFERPEWQDALEEFLLEAKL